MAQEEVIVTKFVADTSELDASLDKATQGLDQLDAAGKKTEKGASNLSASLGSVSAKSQVMTEANKRAAGSLNQVTASAKGTAVELGKVGGIGSRIGGAFQNGLGKVKSLFSDVSKGAGNFFSQLTSGLSSAIPGVGGLGGAFSALTGPIGLAVAAVGGLITNFTRLDAVATFVDGLGIQLGFIGDRLANLDFRGLFDPATIRKDIANSQILANLADQLVDKQLDINKANADAGVELAKLNNKLRDRTKTEQERLAIADEITAIEAKRSKDELQFLDAQVAAQRFANAQQLQNLGEVNDENKAKLNELEVARANALASSIALTENVERRRNSITEQGAAERAAIESKREAQAAAAQAKAAAERDRLAKERVTLEQSIADTIEQVETAGLRRSLSKEEQRIFDIEQRYEKLVDNVSASFDRLAAAGGDTSGRDAAIGTFNTERDREILAEQQKIEAERVQLVEDRVQKIADIEEEASTKRLEAAAAEDAKRQEQLQNTVASFEDFSVAAAGILGNAATTGEGIAENQAKALTTLALDLLEKVILMKALQITAGTTAGGATTGGPAGAIAGGIQGLLISAAIKTAFAALKGLIAGAYTGEESIGGPAAFPGEARDTHLRRVHPGERIVTAEKNKKHWNLLHSVHTGDVDGFIESNYVIPRINEYLNSDTGQRMATSVMLAKFYDKGIREDLRSTRQSIDELPEAIAAAMMHTRKRGHRRMFA
jgi:hypothetical protein